MPFDQWHQLSLLYLACLNYERGLSANTIDAYRRDLRRFLRTLDRQQVAGPDQVQAVHVQAMLVEMGEAGLALTTIARAFTVVRCFLAYLRETGELDQDIAGRMQAPKPSHMLPQVLTEAQVERMLEIVIERGPKSTRLDAFHVLRDRAILETLYATGARCSELCSLGKQDIALGDAGMVRLFGKGGRERMVPLGSFAKVAIKRWLAFRKTQASALRCAALFTSRTGQPLDRTAVWRIVRRYAAAAGIAGSIGPHTLRHSCATHMLLHGCNLRSLQEFLGHESVNSTERYTHLDGRFLRETHAKHHPREKMLDAGEKSVDKNDRWSIDFSED